MRPKIDINKLKHLPTAEDMFVDEYGAKGTASRDEFDAKFLMISIEGLAIISRCEVLKLLTRNVL